jgi:hypothetical protein
MPDTTTVSRILRTCAAVALRAKLDISTCVGLAEKVVFLIILVYPVNLLASGCNLNLFLFTRNLLALELRQVQISRFLSVDTQQFELSWDITVSSIL